MIGFLRFGLPESPRWLARRGRLAEADAILRRIEAQVEAEYGPPAAAAGAAGAGLARRPLRRSLAPADARARDPDERVQRVPDRRLLRLPELGADACWSRRAIGVTKSLGYTTVIALAAPVGPLIGFFLGERIERKWVIVGLRRRSSSSAASSSAATRCRRVIVAMGLMLQVAANGMSYSFHAYQQELFPTGLRARASGFVYSWSRLSVIFSSFVIAYLLKTFGVAGVFVFIAGAMAVVMATIGLFGPRTSGVALEKISS